MVQSLEVDDIMPLIENPFESGHIKNYLLLYAGVVIIMVLFFIASSFFKEIEAVQQKVFQTKIEEHLEENTTMREEPSKFKLLDKAY
jgi:hypothetical protein